MLTGDLSPLNPVSIHAPAKGRSRTARRDSRHMVSIHAPAKGRTRSRWMVRGQPSFNPRPREGANGPDPRRGGGRPVSIHAPAKGRIGILEARTPVCMFQSTPPRRGKFIWTSCGSFATCFNPRPREGANGRGACRVDHRNVSIHAPAKGRTASSTTSGATAAFQSTPPRRGEGGRDQAVSPHGRFNPRPREGANFGVAVAVLGVLVSIHAPAKGRRFSSATLSVLTRFQSTPPRRGEAASRRTIAGNARFNPRPREGAKAKHYTLVQEPTIPHRARTPGRHGAPGRF